MIWGSLRLWDFTSGPLNGFNYKKNGAILGSCRMERSKWSLLVGWNLVDTHSPLMSVHLSGMV